MQLVTGCNAGYLPRMMPYLDSLHEYADFPVNDAANNALHAAYQARANKAGWLHIGGRLGAYRYWNMDASIAAATTLVEKLLNKRPFFS